MIVRGSSFPAEIAVGTDMARVVVEWVLYVVPGLPVAILAEAMSGRREPVLACREVLHREARRAVLTSFRAACPRPP